MIEKFIIVIKSLSNGDQSIYTQRYIYTHTDTIGEGMLCGYNSRKKHRIML